jgi:hypothetical protein
MCLKYPKAQAWSMSAALMSPAKSLKRRSAVRCAEYRDSCKSPRFVRKKTSSNVIERCAPFDDGERKLTGSDEFAA